MKTKRRIILSLTIIAFLVTLVSGCGLFGVGGGPRDGKGPRRDGSGGGPCNWLSMEMPAQSNHAIQARV
ncbi:hypothetical protein KJ966_23750 [bacterium]|nr:hypothetical protein [bacterium]